MAVKKIFVPLQNAAAAETSLKAAIAIARRHKAHIDALHIRQRPNVPAGGYYPVGVIFVDEHLSELKEALEAEAAALLTGAPLPTPALLRKQGDEALIEALLDRCFSIHSTVSIRSWDANR